MLIRSSIRETAFSRNFDSAQAHMAQRFRLADLYWTHNPKEYKENNKNVQTFIDHYVALALRKSAGGEKLAEEGHQKQRYVFLEELATRTRDPVELRAQLLNILLAGRDTTASLLSWLFHQLLRNPEIFAKLREAIINDFGTYENSEEITFSSLKSCTYLQNCLSETLRLWTVVPGNSRRTTKITTLPRGGGPDGLSPIVLPANMEVNYSIHVMHRRKDLWGPDAEEFKPERFQGRKPGWEFLPFNGGPRICIGQQFALTEASYVVVRLLQRFDKLVPAEGQLEDPVRSRLTLTSCPALPVTMKMRVAKE
jgi:cytochrome P450